MLKGANWGMDEGMLRCDRQGFEARLRMEKDMNFTILRNCLGNVSKEDFFDLCDQYGLMVWEEFGINHNTTPHRPRRVFRECQGPDAGTEESRLRGLFGVRPTRAVRRSPSNRPCRG